MADDEPVWPAWIPASRSYSLSALRFVHRRLHLFSWVMPRPKEPEGDSLQIAFRVADPDAGRALLAQFGLVGGYDLQRPVEGPFIGATVQAFVNRFPSDRHGDVRRGQTLAVVRLWNDEAAYEVTPELVEQAEVIERRLMEMGADALHREHDLLSWVTRERDPEFFGD